MALIEIPKRLPILFIQNDILLPGSSMRVPISQPLSMNIVKSRLMSRRTLAKSIVGIVTVEDLNFFQENLNKPDYKVIGTAAFVLQVVGSSWPKSNMYTLYVSGICRFNLENLVMEEPYPVGVVRQLDYHTSQPGRILTTQEEKLLKSIQNTFLVIAGKISNGHSAIDEIKKNVLNESSESLADFVMSMLLGSYEEKKQILLTLDAVQRMEIVLPILKRQMEESEKLSSKSGLQTTDVLVLALPKELIAKNGRLGMKEELDHQDGINEIDDLHNKTVKLNLPADVNKTVMRDLHRLKKMGPFSPENSILRNYIEFVVELPWNISSSETLDIPKARKDLNQDHYGMDRVKQRVLEYLAVRQLKASARGPILCFVGPPGVGKTSIGRSIAQTLGRQFQRISLGGVSNQSDIRGHRRTYIGAMPGRIIQAIKNAGVNNPVILLDEVDKMSSGLHGDPAAALLEVLDPLQNHHFMDHYLNVPFDLSQVTFIATANQLKTIPAPLLDRMETITVSGYTLEEKLHIADHHLLPKQLKENGLDSSMIEVPLDTTKLLISAYTSEAGVRNLERRLGALCRAVAVRVAEKNSNITEPLTLPFEVTTQALEDILGPAEYAEMEVRSREGSPGVAVGLSVAYSGGKLMVVECSKLAGGEGKLVLTGHLGHVMRESARLAFNWVRSVAYQYGLVQEGEDLLTETDVHVHFPAGAVSKDGPSAGITIATALISLFTDVPLIPSLAMSGELTLRGIVLPVGGVREKLLAAHRSGIRKVILPKLCMKDLYNVPQSIKDEMSFMFVSHMEEVIDAAFNGIVVQTPHTQSPFQSRL